MTNILDITPEPSEGIDADLERLGFECTRTDYSTWTNKLAKFDYWNHSILSDVSAEVKTTWDGDDTKTIIRIYAEHGKRSKMVELTPEKLHELEGIKYENSTFRDGAALEYTPGR